MDGRPMSIPELLLVLAMLQFSNRDHKSRMISFLGWKVPYKNTMKQKKITSMLFVIYGCHNRLSSFWFLLTIHIFVRFNHLCSLWSFPLKPANKYPAVLGFLIEAHSRANPTTGFFSAYKHSTGALCSPRFTQSQSPK